MLPYVFLLIQLGFFLLVFYLTIAFVTGAPFVPSDKKAEEAIVKFAGITKGRVVMDLGSGDGRLLIKSARMGARCIGYEINPFLVLLSGVKAFLSGYGKNISFRWKNFWKAGLEDADVIYVYLLPWKMDRLEKMLQEKAKKGTLVISNSFVFPHLKMLKKDETAHVYLFRI